MRCGVSCGNFDIILGNFSRIAQPHKRVIRCSTSISSDADWHHAWYPNVVPKLGIGTFLGGGGVLIFREVVVATASDVDGLPGNLAEGVYVAGTGSTGAMPAMATLAGCYSAAMLAGAWGNRVPRDGWAPEGCEDAPCLWLCRYPTAISHTAPPPLPHRCQPPARWPHGH